VAHVAGLHCEVSGDGSPLLLLHAGVADARMWDPLVTALGDRHRCIRYDARGIGRSPDPDGEWSLHEDALAVLDALAATPAHVVGVSMGGRTAVEVALARPDAVRSLVVVASGYDDEPFAPEILERFAAVEERCEAGDLEGAGEIEARMWFDGPGRPPRDSAARRLLRAMNDAILARELAREREGRETEPTPFGPARPETISAPTLVVAGEHDWPSINAAAARLATAIPGARHEAVEGAAHVAPLEQPAAFNRLLGAFLAAPDAQRGQERRVPAGVAHRVVQNLVQPFVPARCGK